MSELLVNTIKKADGTGSITVPADTGTVVTTASPSLGRRNLIINGAMQVWQRGTSSTAVGSSNTYHADRFLAREDTDGGLTTERSTESPDNFKYSTKVTVTSADTSLGAAQKAYFSQRLEGTVWDHLNFGTSAAQTVTLSFYVRSSLTGTFSGSLINDNNNRAYPWEYTINTADTWERKTITIAGDTTGTWDTGSSDWMELYWDLGLGSNFEGTAGAWAAAQDFGTSGSVKLIGTNSATWYITGVQLEVGDTATPFEHRSYGEELALCQRYYEKFTGLMQYSKARETDRLRYINFFYKQVKRGSPTITISGTGDGTSFLNFADNSTDCFRGQCHATGDGATPYFSSVTLDAEL